MPVLVVAALDFDLAGKLREQLDALRTQYVPGTCAAFELPPSFTHTRGADLYDLCFALVPPERVKLAPHSNT